MQLTARTILSPMCWILRVGLTNLGPFSLLQSMYYLYSFFFQSHRSIAKTTTTTMTTKATTNTFFKFQTLFQTLVRGWLHAEGMFFALSFADRYLNGRTIRRDRPTHWPEFPALRRKELFDRIMEQNCRHNVKEGQQWLVGWFGNCNYYDLQVDNVREFLAWAWFDQKDTSTLNSNELIEVETTLNEMQRLTGKMKNGKNINIHVQRQSIDPWYERTTAHPLLLYASVSLMEHVAAPFVMYYSLGFQRYQQGRVHYWHHPGNGGDLGDGTHPILFFHGIGVGLAPYYHVMKKLMSLGRPVYVAEIPEATMSLGTSMPFHHTTPISILEILTTWDEILLHEKKYSIVGHSYGECVEIIFIFLFFIIFFFNYFF